MYRLSVICISSPEPLLMLLLSSQFSSWCFCFFLFKFYFQLIFAIRNVRIWDIWEIFQKITPFRTAHIRDTRYAHWNLIWSSASSMHFITILCVCVIFFCDFVSFHFASSRKTSTDTHPVTDQRNFPSTLIVPIHVSNVAASSAPIGNVLVCNEKEVGAEYENKIISLLHPCRPQCM